VFGLILPGDRLTPNAETFLGRIPCIAFNNLTEVEPPQGILSRNTVWKEVGLTPRSVRPRAPSDTTIIVAQVFRPDPPGPGVDHVVVQDGQG